MDNYFLLLTLIGLAALSMAWMPAISKRTRILVTGMGEKNARVTIEKALEESKPEAVITCGFAGGLNPSLRGGTVIFSADENLPFLRHPCFPGATAIDNAELLHRLISGIIILRLHSLKINFKDTVQKLDLQLTFNS